FGAGVALIKGSEVRNAGLLGMVGDEKTFVLSVDGKRILAGMAGWNTDVKIDAGLRILTVEFDSPGLGTALAPGLGMAQADLEVNAISGSNYIVQSKVSRTSFDGTLCVDFWVTDAATGKTVTSIIGARLSPMDEQIWNTILEFYGLPPYAESGGAQHAHPPLDQGGNRPSATGPKYAYTEQKDSASVGVGQTLKIAGIFRSPYAGKADVSIDQIDGLEVGFPSGIFNLDQQSQLWAKAGKVWISPGKHALALTFSQLTPDETSGPFTFTGSYTVDAEFAADRMYRFTASSYEDLCCINLWDETGGPATRSCSGSWVFRGQQTYSPPPLDTPDDTPTYHHEHKRK
ncbi:MAG TPA: hypothetical protein VMI53_03645, partial [Opitutaceae bacterium]|nr:hypothetical protein [Opitutaceae bacterium]